MGSRSHPHRVLSVCVCVCVSRCLWVCVIEADSLQLRVITVGLYLFLSRSLLCQILAVFAVVVYGPFWFRDSWALLLPGLRSPDLWLPIASLRYPRLPYGELRFCLRKAPLLPTESSASALRKAPFLPTESSASALRKAPFLPTESSASVYEELHFSFSLCITSCNKLSFPQLNPPVFIVTEGSDHLHGFSGDSWFARTDIRQQRSYGSPGGEWSWTTAEWYWTTALDLRLNPCTLLGQLHYISLCK